MPHQRGVLSASDPTTPTGPSHSSFTRSVCAGFSVFEAPTGRGASPIAAVDTSGNVQPAPEDPVLASRRTYWESTGHVSRRVPIPGQPVRRAVVSRMRNEGRTGPTTACVECERIYPQPFSVRATVELRPCSRRFRVSAGRQTLAPESAGTGSAQQPCPQDEDARSMLRPRRATRRRLPTTA
jgi:hypothetical protein